MSFAEIRNRTTPMWSNRMDANRFLQKPPPVNALLESFALDREYVPRGMRRVSDCDELPLVMQRIARKYEKAPFAWCSWGDERRTVAGDEFWHNPSDVCIARNGWR
jgi:hypothetical protein